MQDAPWEVAFYENGAVGLLAGRLRRRARSGGDKRIGNALRGGGVVQGLRSGEHGVGFADLAVGVGSLVKGADGSAPVALANCAGKLGGGLRVVQDMFCDGGYGLGGFWQALFGGLAGGLGGDGWALAAVTGFRGGGRGFGWRCFGGGFCERGHLFAV